MAARQVVVVGSVNLDHTIRVPRLPAAGESLLSASTMQSAGGKGANQAVTAARLDAPTSLIGVVGDDPAGRDLRRLLAQEGVDVTHLHEAQASPTGMALITVDDKGSNTIVVAPEANHQLSPEHIDEAVGLIAGAAILLAQLEVPLAAVARALEVARGAGVTTILNAAPAMPSAKLSGILPLVEIVVLNETEAATMTGLDEPAMGARRLTSRGPQSSVVTLGAEGAMWYDGALLRRIPAYPAEAVDTTGAGDAFCGALAAALADGRAMTEALDWAAAAGACAVSRAGALPSLPTRAEIAARLVAGRE